MLLLGFVMEFLLRARRHALFFSAGLAVFLHAAAACQAHGLITLHQFCAKPNCADGQFPLGVSIDQQGNVFGVTSEGGGFQSGTLFELSKTDSGFRFRTLYNFCSLVNCTDGSLPVAAPIPDVNGNLFGLTTEHGFTGGTIYRLSRHRKLDVVYTFCAQDCDAGYDPVALTYAGAQSGTPYDGTSPLYGVTDGGFTNGGAVFEIIPRHEKKGAILRVLYQFCLSGSCPDGGGPNSLVMDTSGNLFGATSSGGSANAGVAFELQQNGKHHTWTEQVLYNFCQLQFCSDGQSPNGLMAIDGTGALYGTTQDGGNAGVVYKILPNGMQSQEQVLYSFCLDSNIDGCNPFGGVLLGSGGVLFGTTGNGGPHNGGTVFRLNGSNLRTLHAFCKNPDCPDGSNPQSNLVTDASGDLFGTANASGKHGGGTVYEIIP